MIRSDHKISFETKMVVKPTFSGLGKYIHLSTFAHNLNRRKLHEKLVRFI